jgi:hypothetical protein
VPAGFDSDYASVPRPLWAVIPPHYYPHASILHDWLYSTQDYDRATCDAIYREALIHSGASRIYAGVVWAAVRLCAWWAWRKAKADINLYQSLAQK